METIASVINETAKEMIISGVNANIVASQIANKFGFAVARLVMIDIALDLGIDASSYINGLAH